MFKFLKRIFYFISIFLLFFVVKEFIAFYAYLKTIDVTLAYIALGVIVLAVVYFVIIPIAQILKMPVNPGPVTRKADEKRLIARRMKRLRKHRALSKYGIDPDQLNETREHYDMVMMALNKEAVKIRRKHVSQVFYRTGIIQNGFIDALLILSSSVALIKELFVLYNGRVSNKDIWTIARQVYYSLVIGGSETVEYATDEVFSKVAGEGMKNIPFLDKIISSVADGFVNAVLITRVSMITENYCTRTYVEKYSDLYPNPRFIVRTAQSLTAGMINNINLVLKKMTSEKTVDVLLKVGNPVGYIFERGIDMAFADREEESAKIRDHLKTGFSFIGNPIVFGIEKMVQRSRQKQRAAIERQADMME